MTRTPCRRLSPERKIVPVLNALRNSYGRPRRPKRDPLEVLVRGVLSQNTSDVNSERAYDRLMRTFGDWEALTAASAKAIERAIREGGLAAQKAVAIGSAMAWVSRRGGGSLEFLKEMETAEAERQLTSVRGVGVKTARLVLLFGFGRPVFVVDTHVHRVTRRLGLVPPKCTRQRAHLLLDGLVPDARKYGAHMNMIRHGRQVCRARSPLCERCPIMRWCVSVQAPA